MHSESVVTPNQLADIEQRLRDNIARRAWTDNGVERELMKAFKHFDANQSGRLSRSEFAEALNRFLPVSRVESAAIFAKHDGDRNGKIDYKEFVSALYGKGRPVSAASGRAYKPPEHLRQRRDNPPPDSVGMPRRAERFDCAENRQRTVYGGRAVQTRPEEVEALYGFVPPSYAQSSQPRRPLSARSDASSASNISHSFDEETPFTPAPVVAKSDGKKAVKVESVLREKIRLKAFSDGEQLLLLRRAFKHFDTADGNTDGLVDLRGFVGALGRLSAGISAKDAEMLFEWYDEKGIGQVEYASVIRRLLR
jgi:Ca2+-binding EF-hand superfamily protein